MSQESEIYDSLKVCSKTQRAEKRREIPEILKRKGIKFETKNNGAHLVIHGRSITVDFWPGTGKWIARGDKANGYGVVALLKLEGLKP